MASPAVCQAMDRCRSSLKAISQQYAYKQEPVAAWEAFLGVVTKEPALYWVLRLPCNVVACHPRNRKGSGLQVSRMIAIGTKQCRSGYSYQKACMGAYCQTPPTKPKTVEEYEDWNDALSQKQPLLPALLAKQCYSIGAGHCNGWNRLVKGGAPIDIPDLSQNGKLDAEYICRGRPGLAEAQIGLEWKHIHAVVFEEFPDLLDMGITALNNKSDSEVSEREGLMTIAETAETYTKNNKAIDFNACMQASLGTQPSWSPWAAALRDLCKVMTPGQVRELDQMVSIHQSQSNLTQCTDLHMGGAFCAKVAEMKWSLQDCPRVRQALLFVQHLSTSANTDSNRYSMIKENAITKIMQKKNYAKTTMIVTIMEDA